MKYQNLKSFQKHLASAAPNHLCKVYLVLMADDFERARVLEEILALIQAPANRFSGVKLDLREFLDSLGSMSLFGESVALLDEAEKISKKEIDLISENVSTSSGYVLIGARSKMTGLAKLIEKQGVVFDLLGEKPWDKEKRLADELIERGRVSGKVVFQDVTSLLFERLGLDSALLVSEMDKLICFVGDRPKIEREDVLAISPASHMATLWQTAESVIWDGANLPELDVNAFHALVPILRNQLHLGLTLATLIEEKKPADQWSQFLPKLWPKTLEKRSSGAARLGSAFFKKGMHHLFEIELLSRVSSTDYLAMLDLFRMKLHAR